MLKDTLALQDVTTTLKSAGWRALFGVFGDHLLVVAGIVIQTSSADKLSSTCTAAPVNAEPYRTGANLRLAMRDSLPAGQMSDFNFVRNVVDSDDQQAQKCKFDSLNLIDANADDPAPAQIAAAKIITVN